MTELEERYKSAANYIKGKIDSNLAYIEKPEGIETKGADVDRYKSEFREYAKNPVGGVEGYSGGSYEALVKNPKGAAASMYEGFKGRYKDIPEEKLKEIFNQAVNGGAEVTPAVAKVQEIQTPPPEPQVQATPAQAQIAQEEPAQVEMKAAVYADASKQMGSNLERLGKSLETEREVLSKMEEKGDVAALDAQKKRVEGLQSSYSALEMSQQKANRMANAALPPSENMAALDTQRAVLDKELATQNEKMNGLIENEKILKEQMDKGVNAQNSSVALQEVQARKAEQQQVIDGLTENKKAFDKSYELAKAQENSPSALEQRIAKASSQGQEPELAGTSGIGSDIKGGSVLNDNKNGMTATDRATLIGIAESMDKLVLKQEDLSQEQLQAQMIEIKQKAETLSPAAQEKLFDISVANTQLGEDIGKRDLGDEIAGISTDIHQLTGTPSLATNKEKSRETVISPHVPENARQTADVPFPQPSSERDVKDQGIGTQIRGGNVTRADLPKDGKPRTEENANLKEAQSAKPSMELDANKLKSLVSALTNKDALDPKTGQRIRDDFQALKESGVADVALEGELKGRESEVFATTKASNALAEAVNKAQIEGKIDANGKITDANIISDINQKVADVGNSLRVKGDEKGQEISHSTKEMMAEYKASAESKTQTAGVPENFKANTAQALECCKPEHAVAINEIKGNFDGQYASMRTDAQKPTPPSDAKVMTASIEQSAGFGGRV